MRPGRVQGGGRGGKLGELGSEKERLRARLLLLLDWPLRIAHIAGRGMGRGEAVHRELQMYCRLPHLSSPLSSSLELSLVSSGVLHTLGERDD